MNSNAVNTLDHFSVAHNTDSKEWLRGTYHYTETEGEANSGACMRPPSPVVGL
ncbi:uncharacterized protein SCHCODRAFT_01205220 [Schizophyllum commune H4-8]|uniref:uncharacterized protein n=1 Tax=Schizophyllum commune (strain H4-8 / FGSC 9210) TaxID=578458 RepID=UPI00215E6F49|nr:uncharacterized protein SCHCODRAFT_01205220 [Schizophyllum commune H4-8]KAI5887006.1 hypothetical protein SCHCODRAFT_01205220 [Schizophyllum commune H4-8]